MAHQHGGHRNNAGEDYPELTPILAVPVAVLAAVVVLLCLGRASTQLLRRRRLRASLHDNVQEKYARPNKAIAKLKQHLLYAPLFSLRHNREFRAFRNVHMGTLPSRMITISLSSYIILNVILLFVTVDWSTTLYFTMDRWRYAAGHMAVFNTLPLVLTAGRNNPLISLTGISFDTFNTVHRWIGRIVCVEALVHMTGILVAVAAREGPGAILETLQHKPLFIYGLIAVVAFTVIFFQSVSPLRHSFYELFLHFHIILVIVAFVALWYHLRGLLAQNILFGAVGLWGFDRLARFARLIWRNCGKKCTNASIEILSSCVARVDVRMARPWNFRAGQHIYMYIPALGLWTSHPFSAAWVSTHQAYYPEKNASSDSIKTLLGARQETTVSFLIQKRDGFTSAMVKAAEASPGGRRRVKALVEGPYGAVHSFASYGTVLLIAGGIGITHPLSHLRELVHGFSNRTVTTRKIVLIWVVKKVDNLFWVQPWMSSILMHPSVKGSTLYNPHLYFQSPTLSLSIHLFITGHDPNTDDFFPTIDNPWTGMAPPTVPLTISLGKPHFGRAIEREMMQQVGAMAVNVCGPGSMGDDVRRAVREVQGKKTVDLFEEAFSW
ncbi:hypothetical protein Plec18167_005411 [Paecilomyces lecythidis]|uniref:ferric-chelate reductase (NADPH) n=1 Tax=Paecilomyces lecythidis TaxID=3004212 RepID=A0ABR3XKG9_9EURO